METLAAFYVIITSLVGSLVIGLLAVLYGLEIWQKVKTDVRINKMDKSFNSSTRL